MKSIIITRQKGIGMTEILVAMLLLGIGVIGFSGLQVRAISATHDAFFRTQASAIARDLSERMRLNSTALAVYRNNVLWGSPTTARDACEVGTCTAIQMAGYDIANVANMAATTLPNGQVNVRQCQVSNNLCVYVSWNTTTPTVGASAPNCVQVTGIYVNATPPLSTDCIISET